MVMITPSGGKKKEGEAAGDDAEWTEAYADLVKVVEKAQKTLKV